MSGQGKQHLPLRPRGGEGRVRCGIPERLPMPTSPSRFAGPSLSPLKGGEGLLIGAR